MSKIIWEPYDIFQALERNHPKEREISPPVEVMIYGIFINNEFIFIGKFDDKTSNSNDIMSAHEDKIGRWAVSKDKSLERFYLDSVVPFKLEDQWVPDEVQLVYDTLFLTKPKPEKKPRVHKTQKT